MAYLVFARKYRPQTFEDVVEQSHVTKTLGNALIAGRLAHGILFSGPRGTGKTTIARILAKCANCSSGPTSVPCNQCRSCIEITEGNAIDVLEIDGASNNKVENIRELRENAKYMPAHSPYKIYIIDEVHMLSDAAFNALLKVLEEPPSHVLFIFATTEAQKIPITILSRCQRHDLRRIAIDSIIAHMDKICTGEGIKISRKGLALIAREADGSIRDGLSLLDQIVTCSDRTITDEQVTDILGVIDRQILFDISDALFSGDMLKIIDICNLLYRQGRHLMKFYTELIEHFRNLLLIKAESTAQSLSDVAAHELVLMADQVKNITQPHLFQILNILFEEEWRIKQSSSPKMALEMTFFRLMQIKPAFSFDELIEKLERIKTGDAPVHSSTPPAGSPSSSPSNMPIGDVTTTEAPAKTVSVSSAEPPSENTDTLPTDIPEDISAMGNDEIWERLRHMICCNSPSLGACLADGTMNYNPPDQIIIDVMSTSPSAALLSRKKNIAGIEKHCNDFFKQPMKVTLNVKKSVSNTGDRKKLRQQLENEAKDHPLVNAALKIFNGKIVDIKITQEDH